MTNVKIAFDINYTGFNFVSGLFKLSFVLKEISKISKKNI